MPSTLVRNQRISQAISAMVKEDLFLDLASVATHAAVELDFYFHGTDAGSAACKKLAQRISGKEYRARSIENRVENYSFDVGLVVATNRAFRESGYSNAPEQELTVDALRRMDKFAAELENVRRLEESQLVTLWKTCLAISKYGVGL